MDKYLNEAIVDIAEAEALMYAFETAYLGNDCNDWRMKSRRECAFYAVLDLIRKAESDLHEFSKSCDVEKTTTDKE